MNSMGRTLMGAAAALALAALSTAALSHTVDHGYIQIVHPWAEPAESGSTRAQLTIVNDGDARVVVVAVETGVAQRVELLRDGEPIDRMEIEAGGIVTPEQVGLRLVGLSKPLAHGSHFPAELVLADGRRIAVRFVVGEDATMPEMENDSDARS